MLLFARVWIHAAAEIFADTTKDKSRETRVRERMFCQKCISYGMCLCLVVPRDFMFYRRFSALLFLTTFIALSTSKNEKQKHRNRALIKVAVHTVTVARLLLIPVAARTRFGNYVEKSYASPIIRRGICILWCFRREIDIAEVHRAVAEFEFPKNIIIDCCYRHNRSSTLRALMSRRRFF